MKKYCIISCHVLWREFAFYAAQTDHVFDLRFLPQGLHCTPDLLRSELQSAVDQADKEDFDALLIGYGLCSNGVVGVKARTVPLVLARGHDCITHLLGSKERYREYFDAHPGTYWYSPGWIDTNTQPGQGRYDETLKHYIDTYGEENAEYLMSMEQGWFSHYSNAAYVDLGIGDSERYRQYTREAAEYLNWTCDELDGDPALIKRMLNGEWDDDAFMVVPPGHAIQPSHDNAVLSIVPAHE